MNAERAVAASQARRTTLALLSGLLLVNGGMWLAPASTKLNDRTQVGETARSGVARAGAALRFDPNVATRAELALLPGIGTTLAGNIVRYRESVPPPAFRNPADLDAVPRIGPLTVERLTPFLRFDEPHAP